MPELNPPDPKADLSSWKEIAGHLGVSVRTAQLWERERGLPVRRLPGKRGGRWAVSSELDYWKASSPQESVEAAEAPSRTGRSWAWLAIAVVLIVGAIVWQAWPANNPFMVQVEVSRFRVLDSAGKELWTRAWPEPLDLEWYGEGLQRGLAQTVDLDGDGQNEVLFVPRLPGSGERPVICFDATGRELWRYVPKNTVRTQNGEAYDPPFQVSSVLVLPGLKGEARRIVVASIHHLYFPTQVAILDHSGKMQREYWHSGHLHQMVPYKLGSRQVVLAGGVNNTTHQAALLVIDTETMGGTSRENIAGFKLVAPQGKEPIRILFPRTCINRAIDSMNTVGHIYVEGNGITVTTRERELGPEYPEIQYRFTSELAFESVSTSSTFPVQHERLAQMGVLDHRLSAQEIELLRPTIQ